jgi:hypothetical protein
MYQGWRHALEASECVGRARKRTELTEPW